jgi:hypothetical protein
MPCWPRGVERRPGCDAEGGPATHQANAGRRHDTTAARRDLDIGGRGSGRASDGDGFWRHWGSWSSYQFRMAFVIVGDDVLAIWKHADAAGGGQVDAQSTFGSDERKLTSGSVRAAKAIVGLRPSFSAHVRLGERGAPVATLRLCFDTEFVGAERAARLEQWYPTSRKKRARYGAPGSVSGFSRPSSAMLLPYTKTKECHAKER